MKEIIKNLVKPTFSWFDYLVLICVVCLAPTLGWYLVIGILPVPFISVWLQNKFGE